MKLVTASLIARFLAFSVTALCTVPVLAMEPPRPGEVLDLAARGELEDRLEFVRAIGNHQFDPFIVRNFRPKLLAARGIEAYAPPVGWRGMPTTGDVRTFALLIEFQDYTHAVSQATVDSMLYGAGNPRDYPQDSLTSWYARSSYGLLDLGNGATLGWYRTPYPRSDVPQSTSGRESLIKSALGAYDATHDFSRYDNDGDGDIDYFIVMWTGPDTGWGSFWWGYQTSFADRTFTLDGKTLGKYSWQWEADRPSVVIHETGHALGLPDYYDYDDSVGPRGGVGGFDMMDSGRWDHNCFSKWMLDWLEPTVVSGGITPITLVSTSENHEAVLIWPNVDLGDLFSEYFMVQNRQATANDDDGWFPVDGLAVWHLDTTLNHAGTDFRYNNSFTDRKLLRLMEADGRENIEAGGGFEARDLYSDGDRISHLTTPSSAKYDGSDSCVTVCGVDDLGHGAPISASYSAVCSTPPTCDAGTAYVVACRAPTTDVALDASATSDPDPGDTLAFQWLTDCPGGILDDMHSPTPTLTVTPPPECDPLCNVRLMVSDCAGIDDHCVATIRIEDAQAPQIACPQDASVECTGKCGTRPDDPRLAPFFGGVSATDECAADPVVSNDAPPLLRLGSTAVTFTAADHCANRASCVSNAEVVDTTPPAITVTLDRTTLWPANHKLVRVAADVAVSDLCDPDPTFVLTSISSDEPDNGLGDGDQVNDIQGADLGTPDKEFFLRAERSGQGDGRTYTIAYTALDGCGTGPGNAATATVHVHVPHDR